MDLAPSRIHEYEKRLHQEEDHLNETLISFAKQNKDASKEFTAEFPSFGDPTDEDATIAAVNEYGTRLSAEQALEERLRSVRSALERIQNKTYGICIRCGTEIPGARLDASPEAALCTACSAAENS